MLASSYRRPGDEASIMYDLRTILNHACIYAVELSEQAGLSLSGE